VFGIASRLFSRRVGLIAAFLTALHPLLVNLSFCVLSEAPYATLFLSAVYIVIRALNHPSLRWWSLVGGVFGLAYLLRQEALAALIVAVLFALMATEGGPAIRCKRFVAAFGVFLALVLPQIIFIYKSTGKFQLDGKTAQFFSLGRRIFVAQGRLPLDQPSADGQFDVPSSAPNAESWESWETKWAFYAVDAQLNKNGVTMRSQAQVVREARIKLKLVLQLVVQGAHRNVPLLLARLKEGSFGAPFLLPLVLLGALRRPWRRPKASSRLFLVLVAATPIVSTFATPWAYANVRYYFILVPFLLIWAANGLDEVGRWVKASTVAAGWPGLVRPLVSEWIIPILVGLALLVIYPVKQVRTIENFIEGSRATSVEKQVGLWIHQRQDHARVMDLLLPLTFHAHAQWVHYPYCDGEIALRFLDAAQVDYIVLRRSETFTQYYKEWLERGIPDSRAELLHVSPVADAQFAVYRWHRAG
jgi:4-amino-4-deoxy-L-arabinose transferase-like glycosyltransferase